MIYVVKSGLSSAKSADPREEPKHAALPLRPLRDDRLSILMAAVCWGSYGPMLHQGQMKMGGSRLRPFACVGIAYFIIAVAAPLVLLNTNPTITKARGQDWGCSGPWSPVPPARLAPWVSSWLLMPAVNQSTLCHCFRVCPSDQHLHQLDRSWHLARSEDDVLGQPGRGHRRSHYGADHRSQSSSRTCCSSSTRQVDSRL